MHVITSSDHNMILYRFLFCKKKELVTDDIRRERNKNLLLIHFFGWIIKKLSYVRAIQRQISDEFYNWRVFQNISS